jgi:hypothetical protein
MGSNVNNKATSGGHEEVVFQSKDIASKTKAGQKKEYFVKFKEKTAGQKFSEWCDKYKRKIFIILCAIVGAAVVIFAIIFLIKWINRPTPEQTRAEHLNQIAEETQSLLEQTQYTAATENIEKYISEAKTDEEKAEIYTRFALVTYKTYENGNALDEILDYLYKAEGLNPTAESAMNIVVVEKIKGNSFYADIYEKEAYKRDPNYDVEENDFYNARKVETNETQE